MGTTIKDLLAKNSAFPRKSLGQNFLTDKNILKKIIETADISPNDIILEIGSGTGILTQELAKKAKKVIAVEKDAKMVEILKEELMSFKNVEVIQADILKIENLELFKNLKYKPVASLPVIARQLTKIGNYKIVANLPYYITSSVIRKFLEIKKQPKLMVLMVQKEVARRIVAKPPDMNLLAVSVQFYAKPEIIKHVSKKSFWPEPKVDSAILRIAPLISADKKLTNTDLFFKIVKAGFSQPRKQLVNNLSRLNFSSKNYGGQAKSSTLNRNKINNWLLKNKIQPTQRAETLTIEDWKNLTKTFGN